MKFKILLILLIILSLQFTVLSAELKVENLGDFQRIILSLDGSVVDFEKGESISRNGLSVIIDDGKQNVVYKEYRDIVIEKENFDADKSVIQIFYPELPKGDYNLYYTFRNNEFGSNYKKNFEFTIDNQHNQPLPVVVNTDTNQIVDNLEQMKVLNRCVLTMVFSEVPDSLFLFYNPQVKVMIPGEKTIEYNFPSELRPKINAECKLAWLIDGKWDSVKVGFEQVFILYSGTYSLKHQLEQIRYIASQNEWKYLKSLKNDPDKTRGIENFWAHYQDGDSNHNSIRTIFYSRVIEADRMFSFKRYKKGWMTDRGRVFIKYGPPDEIISDPLPLESRPYIIWYYYSLNKKFLFEDVKGFGDYELNNIQDED